MAKLRIERNDWRYRSRDAGPLDRTTQNNHTRCSIYPIHMGSGQFATGRPSQGLALSGHYIARFVGTNTSHGQTDGVDHRSTTAKLQETSHQGKPESASTRLRRWRIEVHWDTRGDNWVFVALTVVQGNRPPDEADSLIRSVALLAPHPWSNRHSIHNG